MNGSGLHEPDEALVRRVLESPGSPHAEAAASELFGRYQGRVYLWCFRVVRDHEQALDLAQDALLSAYRGLGSFGGRARFSSWLFAIARNRCLSVLRQPSLLLDEEADPSLLVDDRPGPDRALEEEKGETEVLELIRRHLDPSEQEAIWMRCFERMPVDEITAVLGIVGASGARGVLQSARRKLRAVLRERGGSEGSGGR